jgi:mRNA interferase MazF
MERGEIWWAELTNPTPLELGFKQPVAVAQSNAFNRSRIRTVIPVVLISNLRPAEAPGNVMVPAPDSGLPEVSVANVSQVITVERIFLTERGGRLPTHLIRSIDEGLRLVLSL